jgi:hypothetical protein
MGNEEKKEQNEVNYGKAQTVINIQTAHIVNNNVGEVNTTINVSSGKEDTAAVKEAMGAKPDDRMKEPDNRIDFTPIRDKILEYVEKVDSLLVDDVESYWRKMWEDILTLREVESEVYNPGRQWGVNFNRDLVAKILYHLRTRKIYAVVYKDNYNGAALAEALEGDRDHSVKHALRDDPPKEIREAIDDLLQRKYPQLPSVKK